MKKYYAEISCAILMAGVLTLGGICQHYINRCDELERRDARHPYFKVLKTKEDGINYSYSITLPNGCGGYDFLTAAELDTVLVQGKPLKR